MEDSSKLTGISIMALISIIALFIIIVLAILAPSETTKRYTACVKYAKSVSECKNLLINNNN